MFYLIYFEKIFPDGDSYLQIVDKYCRSIGHIQENLTCNPKPEDILNCFIKASLFVSMQRLSTQTKTYCSQRRASWAVSTQQNYNVTNIWSCYHDLSGMYWYYMIFRNSYSYLIKAFLSTFTSDKMLYSVFAFLWPSHKQIPETINMTLVHITK